MAKKTKFANVPTFDKLIRPVIQALIILGGSGTIEEINEKVFELIKLSNEILQIPHKEDEARSEIELD